MSTPWYRVSRDANQKAIVAALEAVFAKVLDCSRLGYGFADLLVLYRGRAFFLEIKNPERSKKQRDFRKSQQAFRAFLQSGGLELHRVLTIDDAMRAIGLLPPAPRGAA